MVNVFEELEKSANGKEAVPSKDFESSGEAYGVGLEEIDYDKLSNVPVGLRKKFERVDLAGKTVIISKASVYPPDVKSEQPITAINNPDSKYYKAQFIVYFETGDKEIDSNKPQREFYSGVIMFVQKNGSLSGPSFWNTQANNQVSSLWTLVAVHKGKNPDELSPKEFMAFLNSKPKAVMKTVEILFRGKKSKKNIVQNFVA